MKDGDSVANIDTLKQTVKGAAYILTLQLVSRVVTFAMNIFLVRISSLGTLGAVFDMELYLSTILFLSREPIRMALLRNPTVTKTALQTYVNMAFIPIAIGILLMLVGYLYTIAFLNLSYESWLISSLYSAAILLELWTEPMYIYGSTQFFYSIRVYAEGSSFVVQCLSTTIQYILYIRQKGSVSTFEGIYAHAVSQLLYSLTLFSAYYIQIKTRNIRVSLIQPKYLVVRGNERLFDVYLLKVAYSFMGQSVLKHCLTVGDKLVLVTMGIDSAQKGAFRLVSDLGF